MRTTLGPTRRVWRRIAAPITLLLLAPVVGEYLLGDLATTNLTALPGRVLMYGSGAELCDVFEAIASTYSDAEAADLYAGTAERTYRI